MKNYIFSLFVICIFTTASNKILSFNSTIDEVLGREYHSVISIHIDTASIRIKNNFFTRLCGSSKIYFNMDIVNKTEYLLIICKNNINLASYSTVINNYDDLVDYYGYSSMWTRIRAGNDLLDTLPPFGSKKIAMESILSNALTLNVNNKLFVKMRTPIIIDHKEYYNDDDDKLSTEIELECKQRQKYYVLGIRGCRFIPSTINSDTVNFIEK